MRRWQRAHAIYDVTCFCFICPSIGHHSQHSVEMFPMLAGCGGGEPGGWREDRRPVTVLPGQQSRPAPHPGATTNLSQGHWTTGQCVLYRPAPHPGATSNLSQGHYCRFIVIIVRKSQNTLYSCHHLTVFNVHHMT